VFPYKFKHRNDEITLIDTPGFNDTVRGEAEVLRDIADWLDITYRNPPGIKLTGIIYVQALTDRRMYGSSLRNLKMFRELCGEDPLKNVVLITTGWGVFAKAGELDKAAANEQQLRTDPDFWQPLLNRGSKMARFEDTRDSALKIIESLVDNEPLVLKIQYELVDEDKDLIDTGAGATVNEEIKKLEEKYKMQLSDMQQDMAEALKCKDREWQEALAEAKASIERLRENNRRAQDVLLYERRNADRKHENDIQNLRNELDNQKRLSALERENMKLEMQLEVQAQRFEDKMQFGQMVVQMRKNAGRIRAEDRKALEVTIQAVQSQWPRAGRGKKLLLSLIPTIGTAALAALGFPLLGASPFGGTM
jgi:hypothetical protein